MRKILALLSILTIALTHAHGQQSKATAGLEQVNQLRDELREQRQQVQELKALVQALLASNDKAKSERERSESQLKQVIATTGDLQNNLVTTQKQLEQSSLSAIEAKEAAATVKAITNADEKKIAGLAGSLGRFRINGDVRLRYESQSQDYLSTRHRERLRVRLGIDGKLNEDFSGGIALATGTFSDPISTNETATGFFGRKTIGLDKGFITYQPQRQKWLAVTAGKFAYTWTRSQLTLDPDLNPEGVSEKVSFDFGRLGPVKNLSFTGLQLLFNEVASGHDSFAAGGQIASKLSLGSRITILPSYSLLKWRNTDPIAQASKGGVLGGNVLTNDTITVGTGATAVTRFRSGFLYSDLILNSEIKTAYEKFPIGILLNYAQNLDAAPSPVTHTKQDKASWAEFSVGQTKQKGDFLLGYAFSHIDQDAVIAAFTDSERRGATNVIQHRATFSYQLANNTTFSYFGWLGRTANTSLVNAQRAPGRAASLPDPNLLRNQFDITYRF